MSVEIIPAEPRHAAYIAATARQADREELWATSLSTPEEVIRHCLMMSEPMIALIDDDPVCIFGVNQESMIGNVGTPWMIASADVENKWKTFLTHCRAPLLEFFDEFDRLENYVDARNRKTIRWLSWMGFNLEPATPYGMLKMPFHRFWMKKEEA